MRAALELFRGRQYPGVVAVCNDALTDEPGNLYLRLLLSRALLALRADVDAQKQLSECLRREPRCSQAYALLGQLALRRDEIKSAEIFLREAVRLDPKDRDSRDLLEIVFSMNQPTAAVEKLPAATVAVGCPSPSGVAPHARRRFPVGTSSEPIADELGASAGFGRYLVEIGALSDLQLRAALAYHRSTGVRVGGAAVALGFISEPKIEWAAMAYHGRRQG